MADYGEIKMQPVSTASGSAVADSQENVEEEKKLTPHTLRLLRLITKSSCNAKGTKESTQRAIVLLGRIASRSDAIILWDILARLYTSLTSPDESDALGGGVIRRQNIALAMEHVAKYLPIGDQRSFLMDDNNYYDTTKECDGSASTSKGCRQWLTIQDLCKNDDTSTNTTSSHSLLDQVLEKGRLLLSCSESSFDFDNNGSGPLDENNNEMGMLARLDASVSTPGEKPRGSMQMFVKERVELQRNILSRRLGLGGMFSRPMVDVCHSGIINEMVSNEDLVDLPPPMQSSSVSTKTTSEKKKLSARERNLERLKKRRKIESKSDENDDDGKDSGDSMIRRILLLSIDHNRSSQWNSNSTRLSTHQAPQTLLATDLVFHSFHPSWHIRHGSLLGLLAILRAWRQSLWASSSSPRNIFGKWPQDILSRCMCIIALDRFGDYAGPLDVSDENNYDMDVTLRPSTAPVRDAAAQVISLLIEMAPLEEVQYPCFRILQNLFQRDVPWEVRHGAMLSIKNILEDKGGVRIFSRVDEKILKLFLDLIVDGMKDNSDDVKGACAQATSSLLSYKSYNEEEGSLVGAFISQCAEHLWMALCLVQATSSCALDLLRCLSDLVRYDCKVVLSAVGYADPSSSAIQKLLVKLGDLIQFHSVSMRLYCLRTLAVILEPLTSTLIGNGILHNNEYAEGQNIFTIERLLDIYCRTLIPNLFGLFWEGDFDGGASNSQKDGATSEMGVSPFQSIYESERVDTWNVIFNSVKYIFSVRSRENQSLCDTIRETIVGLLLSYLNISSTLTGTRRRTYQIDSKLDQYNCVLSAAETVIKLCACCTPSIEGVNQFLIVTVTALLRSPCIEHCELGCILLQYIGSLDQCTKFVDALEQCQLSLLLLLEEGPICLKLYNVQNANLFRGDAVKAFCEKTMVILMRKSNIWRQCDCEDEISTILQIWSNVGKECTTNDTDQISPSVVSMRVNAALGEAAVCLGPNRLPNKLTTVIRSLVTVIKNENNQCRSRICSRFIAALIRSLQILSPTNEKRAKVFNKLLTNICTMASAEVDHRKGYTSRSSKQSKEILHIVVTKVPRKFTLRSFAPIWERLKPLANTNPAGYDMSSVGDALIILCSIASALQKNSKTFSHASSSFLPTLSMLACQAPNLQIRQDAVRAINNFCEVDMTVSLPMVLPFLEKFTKAIDDDPSRLGSCTLLNAIVCSQGISLCPFVPFLLPLSMATITDSLRSAAEISSLTFAHLVRLAPLVHIEKGNDEDTPKYKVCQWGDDCSREVVEHLILGKPLPPCKIPTSLEQCLKMRKVILRKYQCEGISWMNFLRSTRLNGALCDDMGLGKTIQAVVAIAAAHDSNISLERENRPKSLVVCPSSLVAQWKHEVEKIGFRDVLKVLQYSGPKRNERWTKCFQNSNLVITSYAVLRSDMEMLTNVQWTYCVLDEGHLLKNPKTQTAKAARKLRPKHRLILSGTPIQNNVHELWSVFDWLMPNYLGNEKEFSAQYGNCITKGNLPGASSKDIRSGMEKLKQLHQKVLPFILRRKKEEVLQELPSKIITDIPCAMTELQQQIYANCLTKDTAEALKLLQLLIDEEDSEKSDLDFKKNRRQNQRNVFKSLLSLRLICTHPTLSLENNKSDELGSTACFDTSGKLLALNDLLRRCQIFHDEITGADNDKSLLYLEDQDTEGSAHACDMANEFGEDDIFEQGMARECKSANHKCLIFAQYTQSLDIVEDLVFKSLMPSLNYVRIDGRTNVKIRAKIVESFQQDPDIKCMLLTSKVGSLGLNLQSADTVIFLESDWNPFVDLQAMDRCHRIGQRHNVKVYRLITSDSIEEKIMAVQKVKRAMSDAVVNTENSTMYSMGTDRLLDLFTV